MAQHDNEIANASGFGFRCHSNRALQAIFTLNSGSAESIIAAANRNAVAGHGQHQLKVRNSANTAWAKVMDVTPLWLASTAQRIGRLAFGLTIPSNADTPAAVAGTVDKQKVGRLFPRRFRPDHELPAPMACCFSPADCVRILAIPPAHVQPGGVDAWPAAAFHRPGAGLCTDSRQLRPGAVFVALRGSTWTINRPLPDGVEIEADAVIRCLALLLVA